MVMIVEVKEDKYVWKRSRNPEIEELIQAIQSWSDHVTHEVTFFRAIE